MHPYVTKLDKTNFSAASKNLEDFLFSDTELDPSLHVNHAMFVANLFWPQIIERIFRTAVKNAKTPDNPSIAFWQTLDEIFKRLIQWHSQFICKKEGFTKSFDTDAKEKIIADFVNAIRSNTASEQVKAYLKAYCTKHIQKNQYKTSHDNTTEYIRSFLNCLAEIGIATDYKENEYNKDNIKQGIRSWLSESRKAHIQTVVIDSRRGIWFGDNNSPDEEEKIAACLDQMYLTPALKEYALQYISQNGINHVGNDYLNSLTQCSPANHSCLTFADKLHNYFLEKVDGRLRLTTSVIMYKTEETSSDHPLLHRYVTTSITDREGHIEIKPEHWFQEIVNEQLALQVRKIFYEGGLIKLRNGVPFDNLHEGEQQEITSIIDAANPNDCLYQESCESDRLFLKACKDRTFALSLLANETDRNKILLGPNPADLAKIYEYHAKIKIGYPAHFKDLNVEEQNFKKIIPLREKLLLLCKHPDRNTKQKTIKTIIAWMKTPTNRQRTVLAFNLLNDDDLIHLLQHKEIVKQLSPEEIIMLQNRNAKIAQILLEVKQHALTQTRLLQIAQTHAEVWADNKFIMALTGDSLVTCACHEKKTIRAAVIGAIYWDDKLYKRFLAAAIKKANHSGSLARLCLEAPVELRQKLLESGDLIRKMAQNPYGEHFGNLFKSLEQQKNDAVPITLIKQELEKLWKNAKDVATKENLITQTSPEILRYLLTFLDKENNFDFYKKIIIAHLTPKNKEIDYPFHTILSKFTAELSASSSKQKGILFSSTFFKLFFENEILRNKIIEKSSLNDIVRFVITANKHQEEPLLNKLYSACCNELTNELAQSKIINTVSKKNLIDLCFCHEELEKRILANSDKRQEIITTNNLDKLKSLLLLDNTLAIEIAKLYITNAAARKLYLGVEPKADGKAVEEFQATLIEALEKLKDKILEDNSEKEHLQTLIDGVKYFETRSSENVSVQPSTNSNSPKPRNSDFVQIKEWLIQINDSDVRPSVKKIAEYRRSTIAKKAIALLRTHPAALKDYSDNELLQVIQLPGVVYQLTPAQIVELQKRNPTIANFLLHPVCEKPSHLWNFLRHPMHKLTEEQLLEIAKTRPEAWTGYGFGKQLPSISRSWVGKTRLGRAAHGYSYRDGLSSKSLTECIFVNDKAVRTAAINAIANDAVLSKRLLSSATLFKDPTKFSCFFVEAPNSLQQQILALPNLLSNKEQYNCFVAAISINLQDLSQKNQMQEALKKLWKIASAGQKIQLLTQTNPVILAALLECAEVVSDLKKVDLYSAFNQAFANLEHSNYPFHLVLPQLTELLNSPVTDLKIIFDLYKLYFSQPSLREKIIVISTADSVIKFLFTISKRIKILSDSLGNWDQNDITQYDELNNQHQQFNKVKYLLFVQQEFTSNYNIDELLKIIYFLPHLQSKFLMNNQAAILDLANRFISDANIRKKLLGLNPPENPEITRNFLFSLLDMLSEIAKIDPAKKDGIAELIKQMKQADHFNSEITIRKAHFDWQVKKGLPTTLTPMEFLYLTPSEQLSLVEGKAKIIEIFLQANELEAELLIRSQGQPLAELLLQKVVSQESLDKNYKDRIKSKIESDKTLCRQVLLSCSCSLIDFFCNYPDIHELISRDETVWEIMLQNLLYEMSRDIRNSAPLLHLYTAAKNDLPIRETIVKNKKMLEILLMNTHPNVLTILLKEESNGELRSAIFNRLGSLYLETKYTRHLVNDHPNLLFQLFNNISEEHLDNFIKKIITMSTPRQLIELCLTGNNQALNLLKTLAMNTYQPQLKAMLDVAQTNELKPLKSLLRTEHGAHVSSLYEGITFYQLRHKIQTETDDYIGAMKSNTVISVT